MEVRRQLLYVTSNNDSLQTIENCTGRSNGSLYSEVQVNNFEHVW